MKKRLSLLALVVCLALSLCACGESSTIITLDDEGGAETSVDNTSPNLVSVFSTRDDKEYLEFLTGIDDKYEIVDITTGMDTYACGESYIVTYTIKKDVSATEPVSYKYYLYKTREQSEYLSFYSSFDFDTYEIVDISTRLGTYACGESYTITYRKPD